MLKNKKTSLRRQAESKELETYRNAFEVIRKELGQLETGAGSDQLARLRKIIEDTDKDFRKTKKAYDDEVAKLDDDLARLVEEHMARRLEIGNPPLDKSLKKPK